MNEQTGQSKKCPECGQLNRLDGLVCVNCGSPLPADAPANKGDGLQKFGDETSTGGRKLSRFAEAAARKRAERGGDEPPEDELPDWLKSLRSGLPTPQSYPSSEEDFLAEEEPEEVVPFDTNRVRNYFADEPPPRPTAPGTGDLPQWMDVQSERVAQPPSEQSFYTPPPDMGVEPFELDPAEKGLDTNRLKLPNTDELQGGMPSWLKEVTSPNKESQPRRPNPSNMLQGQPIFEPANNSDEQLPSWLSEEVQNTEAKKVTGKLPDWLKENQSSQNNGDSTKPGRRATFGDLELEKALEEAFDEPKKPAFTSDSGESEDFAPFDFEELPALDNEPSEHGYNSSDSFMLPDSDLPPLDDLFTELDQMGELEAAEPAPVAPEPVAEVSAALEETPEEPEVAEAAPTPANYPWGETLAPWLRGLPLPTYSIPEKTDYNDTISPFSVSSLGQSTGELEMPPSLSDPMTPDFNTDKPRWLEEIGTDELLHGIVSPVEPGETRSISMTELMKQTGELVRRHQTGELTPKPEEPPKPPEKPKLEPLAGFTPSLSDMMNFQTLPSFLDDDDEEEAQTGELKPFDITEEASFLDFENAPPVIGDVNSGDLPAWLSIGSETETGNLPPLAPEIFPMSAVPEKPAPADDMPDFASAIPEPPPEEEEGELPDWLKKQLGTAALNPATFKLPESVVESQPEPEATQSDSPDWLNTFSSVPEQPAEQMPDWLNDVSATEEIKPAEQMPDWLGDVSGTPEAKPVEQMPDWLGDVSATEEIKPVEQMPDWLGDISSVEAEKPVEQMPDWLANAEATVPLQPTTTGSLTPDWLGDVSATEEVKPVEQVPDWLGDISGVEAEKPVEQMPDWLKGTEPETPAPAVDETPDWLQGGATEAITPAVPEIPPWQEALDSAEATVPLASSEQADLEPFDMMDFSQTEPKTPPPEPKVQDVISAAKSEIPDWLGEMDLPVEEEEAEPEPPDWLKAMGEGKIPARQVEEVPKTYSQVGSYALDSQLENIPDWLKEAGATTPEASAEDTIPLDTPKTEANPPTEDPQVGALLREIALLGDDAPAPASMPDWLQPEKPAEPALDLDLPDDIPAWLREEPAQEAVAPIIREPGTDDLPAENVAAEPQPMSTEPHNIGVENFLGDLDGPSWLRSPEQSTKKETGPIAEDLSPAAQLAPGQLPSWLRTVGPKITEEPVEEAPTNIQTGLPMLTLPPTLAGAAVLEALLKPPAPTEPVVEKKVQRGFTLNRDVLLRYLSFLVLLLAVLLGLLIAPKDNNLTVPIRPETESFFAAIDSLQASQKVLVVYDWESDKRGEMQPLSQSITQHIMSRRPRVVALSLNPQGPAIANQIYTELTTKAEYGNSTSQLYKYGVGYLNLGYRPGNEAALRSLFGNLGSLEDYKNGQTASTYQVMQGINGLNDFDLIVVMAGDETSVRTWVEQLGIQPGMRLLLATPSAVAPFAQPYALGPSTARTDIANKSPRPLGLVSGLNGATQYSQLMRDRNIITERQVSLNQRLSAQNMAIIALVLIIVVANVAYLYTEIKKRRGNE